MFDLTNDTIMEQDHLKEIEDWFIKYARKAVVDDPDIKRYVLTELRKKCRAYRGEEMVLIEKYKS